MSESRYLRLVVDGRVAPWDDRGVVAANAGDIRPHVAHERDVEVEGWGEIVTWRTLVSADRTPTAGVTVGTAEIPPRATVEGALHHHAPHEFYFFLSGAGRVHLDGDEHAVEAGSFVFVPGGTRHFVRNTGDEPLRLLYTFPVDAFADVEYVFPES